MSFAGCAACIGAVVFLATSGCKKGESAQWLLNGLLDPTQSGQFLEVKRNEIRGSLSILEEPCGIQNGEEPTPEDLVPEYKEHRFTPGDVISVSIFELMVPGQASTQQFNLSNSGFESVPVLGRVRMVGFTAAELELELKEQIRAAGILPDPEVQVTLLDTRSRRFSVIGSVQRAGTFEIPQPDYRLLSAIADAGGFPPMIEKIYILRRGAATGTMDVPSSGRAEDVVVQRTSREWPATLTMSETSSGPASTMRTSGPSGDSPTSHSSNVDEMKILEGNDAPTTAPVPSMPTTISVQTSPSVATGTTPTSSGAIVDELKILEGAPEPTRQVPIWDAEKGAWVMKAVGPASSGATTKMNHSQPATSGLESPWREGGEELSQPMRIIEIPTKEVLAGDPRYNIVVRPRDVINVPPDMGGEYYVMGNISRSGAYQLTGMGGLTVKEAIASAGGFGPLAWPSRADLVRRVSQDEEQIIQLDLDAIFAGNAPDFYLKPNDIVNVGTTPAAMFLAVLRNAFRFSYGFGFVYDRNFADSDSFQAKEQVKQRRIQEAQLKGLPIP